MQIIIFINIFLNLVWHKGIERHQFKQKYLLVSPFSVIKLCRRKLEKGDSGSILYIREGEDPEAPFYKPLGMFIGEKHKDPHYPGIAHLYQAVFLYQALEDIASTNNEEICSIAPFYSPVQVQNG